MEHKPGFGTRVIMTNGKHGVVEAWPKKDKHQDKVLVHKDGEVGSNSSVMCKFINLKEEERE